MASAGDGKKDGQTAGAVCPGTRDLDRTGVYTSATASSAGAARIVRAALCVGRLRGELQRAFGMHARLRFTGREQRLGEQQPAVEALGAPERDFSDSIASRSRPARPAHGRARGASGHRRATGTATCGTRRWPRGPVAARPGVRRGRSGTVPVAGSPAGSPRPAPSRRGPAALGFAGPLQASGHAADALPPEAACPTRRSATTAGEPVPFAARLGRVVGRLQRRGQDEMRLAVGRAPSHDLA